MPVTAAFSHSLKPKTFCDMIKSDIFTSVLKDVCEATELPESDIISRSRTEEIVDARHLLIALLARRGYYPSMTAARMALNVSNVRRALEGFSARMARSPGLRQCHDSITRKWGL